MMKRRWLTPGAMLAMLMGVGPVDIGESYEVDTVVGQAVVRGRIALRGQAPGVVWETVKRDREFCGEKVPNESLLVDDGTNGVAGVVISLEGVARGKPVPEGRPSSLVNRTCRFFPRVSVVPAGSMLELSNADPVLHNTHIRKSGETFLNVALPPGGRTIHKPLTEPGQLDVRCDAHRFMKATIHVFEHPYFTVTDTAGRFELTQVPPGTYRLRVRHEVLGAREKTVTVPAQGQALVNLELDIPN